MLTRIWLEQSMIGVLGDDRAFWIMTLKLFKTTVILVLGSCHSHMEQYQKAGDFMFSLRTYECRGWKNQTLVPAI